MVKRQRTAKSTQAECARRDDTLDLFVLCCSYDPDILEIASAVDVEQHRRSLEEGQNFLVHLLAVFPRAGHHLQQVHGALKPTQVQECAGTEWFRCSVMEAMTTIAPLLTSVEPEPPLLEPVHTTEEDGNPESTECSICVEEDYIHNHSEPTEYSMCTVEGHHHFSACSQENSEPQCSTNLVSESWPDDPEEQEAMLRCCTFFRGEPENKERTELVELEEIAWEAYQARSYD